MNDNIRQCPNCGRNDEISHPEFVQLVTANREATMAALGVRKGEAPPRARFRLQPDVELEDGEPRVSLRRVSS